MPRNGGGNLTSLGVLVGIVDVDLAALRTERRRRADGATVQWRRGKRGTYGVAGRYAIHVGSGRIR